MNFIKKLFNKDTPKARQLNTPEQLQINDIIEFSDSFALPEVLRGQQLQVIAINSHEFEHKLVTEWALKGHLQQSFYLTVEQGVQAYLKIVMRLEETDIDQIFDHSELADIFSPPGNATVNRLADSSNSQNWTCEQYQQSIFAQEGYFHRQDYRQTEVPSESGEAFEYYALRGIDDQFGLELQVWSDGDTDIFVSLFRPLSDIKEYYPGS